jgi:hypothetical protein
MAAFSDQWFMSNTAKILMVISFLGVAGCGINSSTTSSLTIRMHGSLEAPLGASGSTSPESQTFLFTGVTLNPADGSTPVELYEGDPLTYRVITRPQMIFNDNDISDYDKLSFASITVNFDPTVVVATADKADNLLELESGAITLYEAFTLTAGKAMTLTVRALWGKTVSIDETTGEEVISAPSFTMTIGSRKD